MHFTLRCEDLLDALEKRNEIVKRSEIISEIRGIVADNADLLSITWLKEALTTRLKAVENEVSCRKSLKRGFVLVLFILYGSSRGHHFVLSHVLRSASKKSLKHSFKFIKSS